MEIQIAVSAVAILALAFLLRKVIRSRRRKSRRCRGCNTFVHK